MRLMLLSLPVISAGAVAIQATACDAPQNVEGGDPLFDAGPEPQPTPAGCDSGCLAQAPSNATWTALYKDLFGPAGIGQCGAATRTGQNGTTSCHQSAGDNGAVASGFVCGDTQQSCFDGITSPQANFIGTQVVVACSPCGSYLTQVLRHGDGDGGLIGIMPYFPESVVFSDDDMARVSSWIAAGAANN
jgi:hypothetical protein